MERGGDCNYCFCLSHGERMRHLIAHFDAGQKSVSGKVAVSRLVSEPGNSLLTGPFPVACYNRL